MCAILCVVFLVAECMDPSVADPTSVNPTLHIGQAKQTASGANTDLNPGQHQDVPTSHPDKDVQTQTDCSD